MEKAILVISEFDVDRDAAWSTEDLKNELRELATSSGVKVAEEFLCRRERPTPDFFIGKGKAEEIALIASKQKADVVIFNDELNATQQRNLERLVNTKVIDRTQVILDIFAQRAKSKEGKIQVELAQLNYLLPRLPGRGILLSRLGGGIGTRGPGEQKLELDRRRISDRIAGLNRDLDHLRKQRDSRRTTRRRQQMPLVALVGYTNAGKSTLFNSLTGSQVEIHNKLFTTLDPIIRKFALPNNQRILFVDTVGFLHKLPHHLIEAFKATLEEISGADILVHVLDASHPKIEEQKEAVFEVLRQLNSQDKPVITALNKIDTAAAERALDKLHKEFPDSICISALKRINLDGLVDALSFKLSNLLQYAKLVIPHKQMRLLNTIYSEGKVESVDYNSEHIFVRALISARLKERLKKEKWVIE